MLKLAEAKWTSHVHKFRGNTMNVVIVITTNLLIKQFEVEVFCVEKKYKVQWTRVQLELFSIILRTRDSFCSVLRIFNSGRLHNTDTLHNS